MKRTATILITALICIATVESCSENSNNKNQQVNQPKTDEAAVNQDDDWNKIQDLVIANDITTLTENHSNFIDDFYAEEWQYIDWSYEEYANTFKQSKFEQLKETTLQDQKCKVLQVDFKFLENGIGKDGSTLFYMIKKDNQIIIIGVELIG